MGLSGHCLFGAVRVDAASLSQQVSACHCEMCRRRSGGIQMGIEAPDGRVTIWGPVKVYRSPELAERTWCDVCGSILWPWNVTGPETGVLEFVPGLFEAAAGTRLTREVYADRAPKAHALARDPLRTSKAKNEALHAFVDLGDDR